MFITMICLQKGGEVSVGVARGESTEVAELIHQAQPPLVIDI